jgi:hypothetical protein
MNNGTDPRRRSGPPLNIHIDRLSLDGVPAQELESVAAEFRRELIRLFGEQGPPNQAPASRDCVIKLQATESLRTGSGERAARALYAHWQGDASLQRGERRP